MLSRSKSDNTDGDSVTTDSHPQRYYVGGSSGAIISSEDGFTVASSTGAVGARSIASHSTSSFSSDTVTSPNHSNQQKVSPIVATSLATIADETPFEFEDVEQAPFGNAVDLKTDPNKSKHRNKNTNKLTTTKLNGNKSPKRPRSSSYDEHFSTQTRAQSMGVIATNSQSSQTINSLQAVESSGDQKGFRSFKKAGNSNKKTKTAKEKQNEMMEKIIDSNQTSEEKRRKKRTSKLLQYWFNVFLRCIGLYDLVTDIILFNSFRNDTNNEASLIFAGILCISIISPYILSYSSGIKLFLFAGTFDESKGFHSAGIVLYVLPTGILYWIFMDFLDVFLSFARLVLRICFDYTHTEIKQFEETLAKQVGMDRMSYEGFKRQKVIGQITFETLPQVCVCFCLWYVCVVCV